MEENYPMTLKGKETLDKELEHLIKVERDEIIKAIVEAREHGDLKENAEYHAAKERQSLTEGRILELQNRIAKAEVIDISKITGTRIVFGATVVLLDTETEKKSTYQIVGIDEADSKKGKISYTSPLAKALIGKEKNDSVTVLAPKGEIDYDIEDVKYL